MSWSEHLVFLRHWSQCRVRRFLDPQIEHIWLHYLLRFLHSIFIISRRQTDAICLASFSASYCSPRISQHAFTNSGFKSRIEGCINYLDEIFNFSLQWSDRVNDVAFFPKSEGSLRFSLRPQPHYPNRFHWAWFRGPWKFRVPHSWSFLISCQGCFRAFSKSEMDWRSLCKFFRIFLYLESSESFISSSLRWLCWSVISNFSIFGDCLPTAKFLSKYYRNARELTCYCLDLLMFGKRPNTEPVWRVSRDRYLGNVHQSSY